MTKNHFRISGSHGSVIIIVVFTILALFGMVALVIDSMMAASSQRQLIATAQQLSLGSLQTYLGATDPILYPTYASRRDAALARANQLAGLNKIVSSQIGGQPLGGLELWLAGCGNYPGGNPVCNGGPGGRWIPGHWHTLNNGSDPCGVNPSNYPCFVPNTLATDTGLDAVRVELGTTTAIRNIFGPLLGQAGFNVTGAGQASEVPRFGEFIVDFSSSVVLGSHVYNNPVCPPASPCETNFMGSGYLYTSGYQRVGSLKTEVAFEGDKTSTSCTPPLDQYYSQSGPDNEWCGMDLFRIDPLVPPWVMAPYSTYKRFKDDYEVWPLQIWDYGTSGGGTNKTFTIDTNALQSLTNRPEPLASILDGLNGAVDAFIQRSFSGDKIGLIGFDQRIGPSGAQTRIFDLSENVGNHFQNLADSTETTWPLPAAPYNFVDKLLFPIANRNTNIYGALARAITDINTEPGASAAQNFVVLITDGLATCDNNGTTCSSDLPTYQNAINDIDTNLIPLLVANNIPLHVILVGDYIGTHTLNRNSIDSPGSCMGDGEARVHGKDYTYSDGNDYNVGTWLAAIVNFTGAKFYHPNQQFYEWARETGGGFFPIRAQDPNPDPANCTEFPTGVHASVGGPCPDCSYGDPAGPGTYQRQEIDPQNRTPRQQILEAFLAIMADSPFRIVEGN